MLVRTWWTLYSLERTLSAMTGRPSTIAESHCSVPLPTPITEEQFLGASHAARLSTKSSSFEHMVCDWPGGAPELSVQHRTGMANPGSYFRATVELSIITSTILTSLYAASTMIRSAQEVQHDIGQLSRRLEQWVSSLPMDLNFQEPSPETNMAPARHRMLLGFQLCSVRILLARPSFGPWGLNWTKDSKESFAGRICDDSVEAARQLVDFFPEAPNLGFIYDQGPWWNVVHHLVQAAAVFLLDMSCDFSSPRDDALGIQYVEKVILWLRSMEGPTAERASCVVVSSFESVTQRCPDRVTYISQVCGNSFAGI